MLSQTIQDYLQKIVNSNGKKVCFLTGAGISKQKAAYELLEVKMVTGLLVAMSILHRKWQQTECFSKVRKNAGSGTLCAFNLP